jgi:hypothetical protein
LVASADKGAIEGRGHPMKPLPMSLAHSLDGITIHRIIEQEGPFFDALEFFPDLTDELLAENRWLQPDYIDAGGRLILCVQSYVVRTPITRSSSIPASATTSRARGGLSGT